MRHLTPRWRRHWDSRPGLRRHGLRKQSLETSAPAPEFPITVVADDDIPERVRAHAVENLVHVARFAPRPVLHARVTLRKHRDPARDRPAVAKAALDVSGRSVRAHVAAAHLIEAIDLLADRLRRNLEDLDELERARRRETGVADPGEWRHGDLPTARPEHFVRPPDERELVRRKTYARSPLTLEEAALELQLLNYDFYLFTNADTGEENVVYRGLNGRLEHMEEAPVLLVEDAIGRLDAGGEPLVFFVDPQSRRGHVLYLRYDGHYGLLEPEAS